jgi:uncharacterized membrane protein YccC
MEVRRRPAAAILDFLRTELAPSPARWRATARTTIACLVVALAIVSLHIPHGHWMIMTILVVHQPNAGSSLRKGFERVVGTVVGSVAAIVSIIAFAQQPWFAFPLVGMLSALGLFVSRTSVVPYAALLAAITDSLFLSIGTLEPHEVVRQGLWRMLLISVGVVIGTGAHLLLWPVNPERQLEQGLAETLRRVAGALRRSLEGRSDPAADEAVLRAAVSELPGELALLQAIEARHPTLRSRHVEQLVLLASVNRLTTATASLLNERQSLIAIDPSLQSRFEAVADDCEEHADAIAHRVSARRPPAVGGDAAASLAGSAATERSAPTGPARLLAHVIEMERAVAQIPVALSLLEEVGGAVRGRSEPGLALAADLEPRIFTPAFRLSNTAELVYAMKGGLSTMTAEVLANGLGMSNPATATVTAVIVAQGTVGATLQKAALRAVGAVLGGVAAIAAMVLVFPSIDSLPPFLAVIAAPLGLAAYVTAGGPRTAYVGIQIGMAFAMAVLDDFGPTIDLAVPRDRVLGILLGIAVFTAIDFSLAPMFASREAARRIAEALRHMAALSQYALGEGGAPIRAAARAALARPLSALRRQVVDDLTAALQREDEALFEPGGRSEEAMARSRLRLAVLHQAQAVFLVLLAIVRDRLNLDFERIPPERRAGLHAFAAALGPNLDAIADRMEGRPPRPVPTLAELREALARDRAAAAEDPALFPLVAQVGFYREVEPLVEELERRADAYAGALSSRSSVSPS